MTGLVAALRCSGISSGDRVAGRLDRCSILVAFKLRLLAIITNHINAIVLALATASIGAVFSPTAPDMGKQGILERYRQIRPIIIFTETEYQYNGKYVNITTKVQEVVQELLSYDLKKAILIPSVATGVVQKGHNIPTR